MTLYINGRTIQTFNASRMVQGEHRAEPVTFRMTMPGASELAWYLGYERADGKGNATVPLETTISGDEVHLTWYPTRTATNVVGKLAIIVYGIRGDIAESEEDEEKRWSTLPAYLHINEGLDVIRAEEVEPSALEAWMAKFQALYSKTIEDAQRTIDEASEGKIEEINEARDGALSSIESEAAAKIAEIKTTEGMRGPKGDDGDDYVLTDEDKEEIKASVSGDVDAIRTELEETKKELAEQKAINKRQDYQIQNQNALDDGIVKLDHHETTTGGKLDIQSSKYVAPNALVESVTGKTERSKNIFNGNLSVGGLDASGALTSASGQRVSDYIPVKASTVYYAKCDARLWICYYNASKSFISGTNDMRNATFTTPSGCAFIRVTSWSEDLSLVDASKICINVSDSQNGIYYPYFEGIRHSQTEEVKSISANLFSGDFYFKGAYWRCPIGNPFSISIKQTGTPQNYMGVAWGKNEDSINIDWLVNNGTVSKTFRATPTGFSYYAVITSGGHPTEITSKFDIMVVGGTYTEATMPKFTPYGEIGSVDLSFLSSVPDIGIEGTVVDFVKKTVTWNYGKVNLGSLGLTSQSWGTGSAYIYRGIADKILRPQSNSVVGDVISGYGSTTISSLYADTTGEKIAVTYEGVVVIVSSSSPTGELVYELATPVTKTFEELGLPSVDTVIPVEAGGTVSVISTGAQSEAKIFYQTKYI